MASPSKGIKYAKIGGAKNGEAPTRNAVGETQLGIAVSNVVQEANSFRFREGI